MRLDFTAFLMSASGAFSEVRGGGGRRNSGYLNPPIAMSGLVSFPSTPKFQILHLTLSFVVEPLLALSKFMIKERLWACCGVGLSPLLFK
jgi:hypothetical protein